MTNHPLNPLNLIDQIADQTVTADTPAEAPPAIDLSGAARMDGPPPPAATSDEEKAAQAAQAEEQARQAAKQKRLDRIKADPKLLDGRLRYTLEAAGIERYQGLYKLPGGIGHVVFQTISQSDLLGLTNQAPRDFHAGRFKYDAELRWLQRNYRLACSIRSIEIRDPLKKVVAALFERSEWDLADSQTEATAKVKSPDLVPRRLYDHLTEHFFRTDTLLLEVVKRFDLFEQELIDLGFLLENDPDFFYAGLASESSID